MLNIKKRKNEIKHATLCLFMQAFAVGIFMVYVAWQHNPQGEFHDHAGHVNVGFVIMIFASWFITSSLISVCIYFVVAIIRIVISHIVRCKNAKTVNLAFAQTNNTKTVELEIHNVTVNGGTLHVSVSLDEASYKSRRPDLTFEFAPVSNVVRHKINIPMGECVISIYQDTNNNKKADAGLLGIPKEPVEISDWNGKGPPGNFRKHKITINATTTAVAVNLYQL